VLHVACLGQMRNACRILVGKSEGKKQLTDLVIVNCICDISQILG
jgi:hypothetical protein